MAHSIGGDTYLGPKEKANGWEADKRAAIERARRQLDELAVAFKQGHINEDTAQWSMRGVLTLVDVVELAIDAAMRGDFKDG